MSVWVLYLSGQVWDEVSLKLWFDHLHHVLHLRGLTAVNQLIQRQQLLRTTPALKHTPKTSFSLALQQQTVARNGNFWHERNWEGSRESSCLGAVPRVPSLSPYYAAVNFIQLNEMFRWTCGAKNVICSQWGHAAPERLCQSHSATKRIKWEKRIAPGCLWWKRGVQKRTMGR